MATFHNTVTIARPADKVFAFLADFSNIPAWNHATERTWQTSPGPAGAGATYRQARILPRSSEEGFEVTGFGPPSRSKSKGRSASPTPAAATCWSRRGAGPGSPTP